MRALLATFRSAVAEAGANRTALLSQMAVMALNDLVWVLFWVLFFDRVGEVRGWETDTILLLQAVLTTGGGIALGVLGNARHIGSLAITGGFDAVLTLPVPPLAHVLARKVVPVNLGDTAFGVVLFLVACDPTPARALVFLLTSLVAGALLVSFLVLAGSSAFWMGRSEGGDMGFHSMLMTAAYPVDAFAGLAKGVLYTIVPAAFVASVPAKLVTDLDPRLGVTMLVVTAVFAVLAWAAFRAGLRRYTSGSVWTRA